MLRGGTFLVRRLLILTDVKVAPNSITSIKDVGFFWKAQERSVTSEAIDGRGFSRNGSDIESYLCGLGGRLLIRLNCDLGGRRWWWIIHSRCRDERVRFGFIKTKINRL